jgi:predicted permease
MFAELWRRLAFFFQRKQFNSDVEEEMQHHLAMKRQAHAEKGAAPEEARFAAQRDFGNTLLLRERSRDMWGWCLLEDLGRDVRFGLRMLRKAPGFTIVAVLTLALGVGANTAIFSIVDWLILRPLPVSNAEQITYMAAQEIGGKYSPGFSYPDFEDIRQQSAVVFSQVTGLLPYKMDGLSVGGDDEPIWTSYVTGNFFAMMGLKPALGSFIASTSERSVEIEPVLVLSYSFWKTHFQGDPHVIGKGVLINGHPVTIIGVAPRGFHGTTPTMDTQGYLPLRMAPVTSDLEGNFATDRKSETVEVIARLKSGVKLGEAQAPLNVIAHRLSTQYPATDKLASIGAFSLGQLGPSDPSSLDTMRLIGVLFLILAGFVFLLACLNVANLLLARASGREREMAVRAAMGGGRSRLMRQLLTESVLLALLGCAGGIALGMACSGALSSINFNTGAIPAVLDFRFDWRVFAYAFVIALLAALFVGVAPALRATHGNLNGVLHESTPTVTPGRQRTRSVLVVAQVGGSLMLLIVAGLFVRSLWNVQHSNLGFDPSHVLDFTIAPPEAGYDEAQAQDFLRNLLPRVRALPGVETACFATSVPMGYYSYVADLRIEGYQTTPGHRVPSAGYRAISPGYFETMRIRIIRGRGILDSDGQSSEHVAVINEVMAERYWNDKDPIGSHFATNNDPKGQIEVVGIAKNSRADDLLSPIGPYFYVPLTQHYRTPITLQLRTNLPLATMNREVVDVIHSLAPTMPVLDIQTMKMALDTLNGLLLFQVGAELAASLGILGLLLALVGVYGVVSYAANQRTHEIGVRMALGARPGQILKMIFGQGLLIVATGVIVGILAAVGMASLVGNFLVGVSPLDTITYVAASFVISAVAVVACSIPARHAMRVEPMVALRHE